MSAISVLSARFRDFYGSHPLHLLTMAAGFALLGYVVITAGPRTFWAPQGGWWHSIALWLGAAFVAHDLVLFPLYALADRLVAAPGKTGQRVAIRNYLRMPALGSGLLLLLFFPGIIRQGAPLYAADTGLTQHPFLGRWLLITAALFGASAAVYAARLLISHRRTRKE